MKSNMTIRIRRRSLPDLLVWILVMWPFLFGFFNELLGLPYAVRYIMDAAWMILIVLLLAYKKVFRAKGIKELALWVLIFLVITALVYLVQFESPLYYLWGFRNLFRFYAAFFAFALLLTVRDVDSYMKAFSVLFWVDIAVSLVQNMIYGIERDQLGGLFSAEGGNGFTNIFFLIITAKSVVWYLQRREKLLTCFLECGAALLIAALAEIKFFFVEFLMVLILASLITRFTVRKLWIVLGGILAILAGVSILTRVFPEWENWFTLSWFWEAAFTETGYTGLGDVNRLNAIGQINELWLNHPGERLFGLGLGNCDTSSVAMLNTPFFRTYEHMHYNWISYAMLYLECGWVGLIFYYGFYLIAYYKIWKIKKRGDRYVQSYCNLAMIMTILCVIISVYNSSLRAESGYMAYFVMAVPFALEKRYQPCD